MADDAAKKKAITDWINRPYSDYQKYSEKQRKLFEIFNAYITEHGGWVSSAPNQKNWVRFEVPALSEIPIRLREKNIPLAYIGESTRVASSNIALPVTVFETKLG
jgi:hypothetical protein